MLTTNYRPKKFRHVIGQETAVKIIKAMAMNPERSPRALLLHGEFGCGKTSLARIFGRALFCEAFKAEGEVCLHCSPCKEFDSTSGRYIEYDSSVTGNVQTIKDLKSTIDYVTDTWRVIVFDEIHVASAKAQSALLKLIEEGPNKTFFLFVTTDPDKVLKTIQSRALPIEFFRVNTEFIVKRMKAICTHEQIEVSDDILYRIALKSDGHVRNALMLLDGYFVSRDGDSIKLPTDDMKQFLNYVILGANEQAIKSIEVIMKHPLRDIKRSLHLTVMKIVESFSLNVDNGYKVFADFYGVNVFKLLRLVSDPWVQEAFNDDCLAYSFFLSFLKIGKFK